MEWSKDVGRPGPPGADDVQSLIRERSGRGVVLDAVEPAVEITESWARCLAAGLDPGGAPEAVRVEGAGLRELVERHERVVRIARAEIDQLHHEVAGSKFVLALGSPCGVVLHARCEESFRPTARARQLRVGINWSEHLRGTNALGTCAYYRRPVLVHGGEHFFRQYGTLTCAAAPIFDPAGGLAGILDACSDSCPRPPHTLAMIRMSAMTVENALFRELSRDRLIVVFHPREEYRYTLSAGLIALDETGTVQALNRQARTILQGLPAEIGQPFESLFRISFEELVARTGREERLRLLDQTGAGYAVAVENLPLGRPIALGAPGRGPAGNRRAEGGRRRGGRPRTAEPGFVAEDARLQKALAWIEAAIARGVPVLLRGATGTGKELLARHLHARSAAAGAFVPVNCAALPEALVEAELFGYSEGAFTGARRGGAPGLVNEADGGTLFLDEIGDLPLSAQGSLLRLLDDWMVRPVGSASGHRVDVQLVAATNGDLDEAVACGRFRRDLLYRLNPVEVHLPALAERSDLPLIARHLLHEIEPGLTLDDRAVDLLAGQRWPGNMRELKHALLRAAMLARGGHVTRDTLREAGVAPVPATRAAGSALRAVARMRCRRRWRSAAATSPPPRGGSAWHARPSTATCAAGRAPRA
jgi:sigma-54 dependent transcriptional regulator, acetoin dehydrogenase operon transcriptional activator AcoR